MIGKILKDWESKIGMRFYSKPQKYSVGFQVQVKNLLSQKNQIDVILPFPLENDYQEIIGDHKITPTSGKLKTETKYLNRYIYWQTTLEPNQAIMFKLNFQVVVHPRSISTEKILQISDYDNLDKNLYNQFLQSDKYLNAKNPKVVKLSNNLVDTKHDFMSKIKSFNNYVVKKLNYGNPIEGLYTITQALEDDQVDCGGFDVMLGSLCMAQKIPVRLVSGFWAGYSNNNMHAWLEILLPNGDWMPADPSIENLSLEGRTKKFARLGFVGSDRIALSLGSNIRLKIGNKIINLDILQNPKVLASRGENSIKVISKFEAKII